jgi:thiol-disulfide isomerase/thioredoxin
MFRLNLPPSGRRNAALVPACIALACLVACGSGKSADTPAATPAAAYAEARAGAAKQLEGLKAYELSGTVHLASRPAGPDTATAQTADLTFNAAARWPDRLVVTQAESEPILSLGTGATNSWFFYAPMRAAYQGGSAKLSRDLVAASDMQLDEEHIFNFYGGLGQLLLPADREPVEAPVTESLTVDGRAVKCTVFSLPGLPADPASPAPVPGPSRWWLDPASGFCLKAVATMNIKGRGGEFVQEITYTVTSVTLNGAPAEDKFAFTAPEGVRVAASLEQLTNPDSMTGQPAPDAVLTGLDGKTFKLSDLRGKVVFLDLWATWCGPCRMEMPHLEALHKEFGPDKVVFLCASNEEQPVIEGFLKKNPYTMRIVRISAEDAQTKFKADSIPTGFVIDKDGVIRAHMVGAQSEAQLRKALSLAGVGG